MPCELGERRAQLAEQVAAHELVLAAGAVEEQEKEEREEKEMLLIP